MRGCHTINVTDRAGALKMDHHVKNREQLPTQRLNRQYDDYAACLKRLPAVRRTPHLNPSDTTLFIMPHRVLTCVANRFLSFKGLNKFKVKEGLLKATQGKALRFL